jgi:hypothetical protein
MLMRTAILALGVSAVVASPVYKRQENITDSAGATGTTAAVATDTASVQSSVTSALSSIVESASSVTSTAPAPTETQAGNASEPYTGCPTGYSRKYTFASTYFLMLICVSRKLPMRENMSMRRPLNSTDVLVSY